MTLPLVSAHDRAPDWKWQRVIGILDRGEIATTPEWDTDKGFYWIVRGTEFLQSYRVDPNPATNRDLLLRYADIFSAYRIYTEEEENYLQYELEATVMARVPADEIAYTANLTTAAMIAYEELFFDVRSLLDKDMYIRNFVIGKEIQNIKKSSLATIWKLYGYFFGPHMLKAVVSRTSNPQFVHTPQGVSSSLDEDIMGSFKIACAIAAKNPAGGERDNQHLLGLFTKFAEIAKMADMSANSHHGQVKEHIDSMLHDVVFTIGGTMPKTGEQTDAFNRLRSTGADPSFHQLAELAFTGNSPSLNATESLKYPPIPKKQAK